MSWITDSVGRGGHNKARDVRVVQELLGRHAAWLWPAPAPVATGEFDATTAVAISRFQETAAAMKQADGMV
jgi:hypothetical protein